MHDFTAFVREHLASVVLPPERELKVVDELAAQLEDAYESALARGLTDEEAWQAVQRQIPDWKRIADEILAAEPVIVKLSQPAPGPVAGTIARSLNGARVVLILVTLATGVIALLACVSPARRATRVDPIRVLNEP